MNDNIHFTGFIVVNYWPGSIYY